MDLNKRRAIFIRVIDGQLAEVECSGCGRYFRVDRDEDGDAGTLPEHTCGRKSCTDACERERCYDCGACPEHCDCPDGFMACDCQFQGDQQDARYCPVHGPHSRMAREALAREASDEAAFWTEVSPF